MALTNLPGVWTEKQDGGLNIPVISGAPTVLILGTADSGDSDTPYVVGRSQEAAVAFGSGGTLTRGMYEVQAGGGDNVVLFRIGATSATLEGIGVNASTGGVTIETVLADDTMADAYSFYWDNTTSSQRLVVTNVDTEAVVYDRDWSESGASIDLGEVSVSGNPTDGEGENIGSASVLLTFQEAADSKSPDYDVTLTDGTDGTTPSRMKLFENLYKAYQLLENETFDLVVPMDVYLDDKNIADGNTLTGALAGAYPTAGSVDDILLYFYTEEYLGQLYFWWRDSKASGSPDVYPAGYATKSPNGTDLTNTAFAEVNFAYQLANFCYTMSQNSRECHGVIGVKPPNSISLADVSVWLGKLPTYTTATDGSVTIDSGNDGTGLLGNKFMAGKYVFRAGAAFGGFIATDTGFLDGTEQEDRGGTLIDIGQYISVCSRWVSLFNSFNTSGNGYIATVAPSYVGLIASLDPKSAPTNKPLRSIRLPYRINTTKTDYLAGLRYVDCKQVGSTVVVADAPTAARPDSDYRRLTTHRIVKVVVDAIRAEANPFIGFVAGSAEIAALDSAINRRLKSLVSPGGYLERFEAKVTQTLSEKVNGFATAQITLIPKFELRQVTLVISLQPV
jgi:hypothetical protein